MLNMPAYKENHTITTRPDPYEASNPLRVKIIALTLKPKTQLK